jgi:hypothetical protein
MPRETFPVSLQGVHRPIPTGILLAENHVITRNHRAMLDEVIMVAQPARVLNLDKRPAPHHLTSSRMSLIRNNVITKCSGMMLPPELADPDAQQAEWPADALISQPLQGSRQEVQFIPVRDCPIVSAIGSRRAEAGFMTGGRNGELDAWSWDGRWLQRRLREATNRTEEDLQGLDITWATYSPNSIVGICSLADLNRWTSVSAGGELCLWNRDTLACVWQIPEPGSPRSLAAHPDKPWIAVGLKKGGSASPQSAVVIVEINRMTLDPAWRTATVRELAQAAQEERTSPTGPLDSARLAILGDALEEAGCSSADILEHLRSHDLYSGSCWVVDLLLGKE